MLRLLSGVESRGGGGCLAQQDPANKGSLEDNFSWPNGPQSCLENKEGALASEEPLSGPRSANAIKPFT